MPAMVQLAFDLHDADSDDYPAVKKELRSIKLFNFARSPSGNLDPLPYNTFVGEFNKFWSVEQLFESMSDAVKQAFARCGVSGRAFLSCANTPDGDVSGYIWRNFTF